MYKYSVVIFSLFLLSCLAQPDVPESQVRTASIHTQTGTPPPTTTKQPIPSPTPTFTLYLDATDSPDGNFSAKIHTSISEKPTIEIWDKSGKVLWKIPYQYSWEPNSAPTSNMEIYGWSQNSEKVYFYYSFSYDGWYTLFNGSDLQVIDIYTGKIEKVIAGCCFAFAFSSDMNQIAYTLNYEVGILDLVNGTDKSTAVLPGNYEQTGWIQYSPSESDVVFHTLDEAGMVKSILLNVDDMSQKIILEFAIESIFPAGWAENGNLRYWQLDDNSVFEINKQTLEQVMIGTATPYP